jgi:rod shape-determining protein MreC
MYKWLTEFFRLAKNYIVFSLLISLSFFLISTNNNVHTRGLQVLGLFTTSYIEAGIHDVIGYFTLAAKNRELEEENAQLIDLTARIRLAMEENRQLREMLKLRDETRAPLIPADVIGRTSDGGRYFLTLDAGSASGIAAGDPVVTGTGLVGIVFSVNDDFCLVRTLLDGDSRIAAKLLNASSDGLIVAGDFGQLAMRNVSRRYLVNPGDLVETSSLSSLVPPGIPVGMVTKAKDEPGNIFKDIEVQPAVDLTSISAAFVMKYTHPAESSKPEKGKHREGK